MTLYLTPQSLFILVQQAFQLSEGVQKSGVVQIV